MPAPRRARRRGSRRPSPRRPAPRTPARAALARDHHVRLEQRPLEVDAHAVQRVERLVQRARRRPPSTPRACCRASISTSGSTIGTIPASWQSAAYRASACAFAWIQASDGMPSPIVITARHFAKRAPRLAVLLEPRPEPVEPLGDLLPGKAGQVVRTGVDLDPRDHALRREQLGERRAVVGSLTKRLVVEDHARRSTPPFPAP